MQLSNGHSTVLKYTEAKLSGNYDTQSVGITWLSGEPLIKWTHTAINAAGMPLYLVHLK